MKRDDLKAKGLTDEQIEDYNLILFGDPGSNAVLARVLDQLPLDWTEEAVTFAGASYNPDRHCVSLIFPNCATMNSLLSSPSATSAQSYSLKGCSRP